MLPRITTGTTEVYSLTVLEAMSLNQGVAGPWYIWRLWGRAVPVSLSSSGLWLPWLVATSLLFLLPFHTGQLSPLLSQLFLPVPL